MELIYQVYALEYLIRYLATHPPLNCKRGF